jgi:PadR family transcriptional regulator, regulatory protein PadR
MANDLTYIGAAVLNAIRCGHGYGFQIMAATEFPSGTVYPVLRRLEKAGLIRSQWEKASVARAEQRPARKYYCVTTNGEAVLEDAGKRYRLADPGVRKEVDR